MSGKVLVEVFVPTIGKTMDVFIPLCSPMYEVLELIKKAAADISSGQYLPTPEDTICRREDGNIININLSVYELGIRNGSKLMLI